MSLMSFTKNKRIAHSLKRIHYLMGTFLSIEAFHLQDEGLSAIVETAFKEVSRIEQLLSRFQEDSQLFRINNSAWKEPQVIEFELFSLIAECVEFSKKTNGAFDITVAPLMELWHQAEREGQLPAELQVSELLLNIGSQNIALDKEAKTIFFKNPLLKIDLGAVGKGYALDRAVQILKEKGIEKARLDFGGHLYYLVPDDFLGDYIGIRDPLKSEEIITNLRLKNKSISSSANYERNFKIQNRAYGHLVNPLKGLPIENDIESVSIISDSAMQADILSTAVFILGMEKGRQLIKDMGYGEVIIIIKEAGKSKVYAS